MAFQEFTFVEPTTGLEFMVDIDTDTHKIIDCYGYIKDIEEEREGDYAEELWDLIGGRWTVGQNSLFGHNKNKAETVFMYCVVSCEDEDDNVFLHEVVKKNKFKVYEIV